MPPETNKSRQTRSENAKTSVIVFVHGVFGTKATWGLFPQLLETSGEVTFADVDYFEYKTPLLRNQQTLESCAELFKGWLEQRLDAYKHVFILAHSFGGLVTKQALVKIYSDNSGESKKLTNKLRKIFLFAVPHGGSWLASCLRFVPPFCFTKITSQLALNSLALKEVNHLINEVRELAMAKSRPFPEFNVIYGDEDWIVGKTQAIPEGDESYILRVPANHRTITKPTSSDELTVKHVRNGLNLYAVLNPILEYLRKVPELYGQQEVSKLYVPPSAAVLKLGKQDQSIPDALAYVREVITREEAKGEKALVLVLGEYGLGKTSLAFTFGYEMAKVALEGFPSAMIPIYLNLGHASKTPSILEAFEQFVARYEIQLPVAALRLLLNQYPRVVLILDGLDEMVNRVNFEKLPGALKQIQDLFVSPGVRVLLTCRTTFFRSPTEVGIIPASHVLRLSPFSEDQITFYIKEKTPTLVSAAEALLRQYPKLKDLCGVPIHLFLFVEFLKDRVEIVNRPEFWKDFKAIDLYDAFINKNLQVNFETVPDWPLEDRREFTRGLVFDWFKYGVPEVPFGEFVKSIREKFRALEEQKVAERAMFLANCGFFARTMDRYRIRHRSFLEYFVADAAATDLFTLNMERWETPFYTEIFDYTFDMIQRRGFTDLPPPDQIMKKGGRIAQANFIAMLYRHIVPEGEPVMRKALLESGFEIVRMVSVQGLAMYNSSAENVRQLLDGFKQERNSVIKVMMQRALSKFRRQGGYFSDEVDAVLNMHIDLKEEDAIKVLSRNETEMVLLTYRRALNQSDEWWPSVVGAIYLLGSVRDEKSFDDIRHIASKSKNLEVSRAYEDVRLFTSLPALESIG